MFKVGFSFCFDASVSYFEADVFLLVDCNRVFPDMKIGDIDFMHRFLPIVLLTTHHKGAAFHLHHFERDVIREVNSVVVFILSE